MSHAASTGSRDELLRVTMPADALYMIRKGRKLVNEQGILSSPNPKP
jgi:hypothetical protein